VELSQQETTGFFSFSSWTLTVTEQSIGNLKNLASFTKNLSKTR